MQMKVTVLGSGAWGTALAIVLVENGNDVTMWSHRREAVAEMQQLGVNPKLKDVPLPKELHLSSDLSCVSDSDVVVFATPSFAMRETAKRASSLVRSGTILVSVGKGIEKGSDLRMSQVIRSEISDDCPLVVLCGPTHAEEVGRKIPSGIVAASENQQAAEQVQDLFMNKRFRVYTSSDVVGVEICAALKNVIALCVGMSDGMGFGDNTRALIITRGLAEITRLGTALGGRPETFAGLAGVGDLITTCTSVHSRNHQAGILIGGGMKPAEAIEKVGAVVEGYYAAESIYQLAQREGVDMPICRCAYDVLYHGKQVRDVVTELMTRAKKDELLETTWM